MKNKTKRKSHPPHSKFKAFLAEKNIKLQEIADILNISRETVCQKNNGHSCYTWDEVEKICDHYNISSEIFRYSNVS